MYNTCMPGTQGGRKRVLHLCYHWVGAGLNPGSLEEQWIILPHPKFQVPSNQPQKEKWEIVNENFMTLKKEIQGTKDFYSPRLAGYCENGQIIKSNL